MIKQTLSASVIALALVFAMSGGAAFADEPVVTSETSGQPVATSDEPEQPATNCVDGDSDTNCVMPISDESEGTEGEIAEPGDGDVVETTELDGVEGDDEVEIDCVATPDAEACVEEETPMWPMYVSLGALGAAVLVFIILNLFGGKKKK